MANAPSRRLDDHSTLTLSLLARCLSAFSVVCCMVPILAAGELFGPTPIRLALDYSPTRSLNAEFNADGHADLAIANQASPCIAMIPAFSFGRPRVIVRQARGIE